MSLIKRKPKTFFISINPRPDWTKEKTLIEFPLGLCYVVSETKRAGYDFDLIDLRVEPKSDNEIIAMAKKGNYDVIALGGMSHAYYVIKPLVTKLKESVPESLIIVGGTVVTAMPEKFLRWTKTDVGVIGEGEYTFIEILNKLERGEKLDGIHGIAHKKGREVIVENNRPPLYNLDDKDRPLWELFNVDAYVESAKKYTNKRFLNWSQFRAFPIITSRGCPYRCTFCSNSYYYKHNPIRNYSPEYVINMMKTLNKMFGINYFWFWDELTFESINKAEPLVNELIKAKMGWDMEIIVRLGFLNKDDIDFARKLKKIGVAQLNFALESGSPLILKAMNKKVDTAWFAPQKKVLDKVGIRTGTCIVLGYPQETRETLAQTFGILYENKSYPSVGFLCPAPGSVIYDYAVKHGHITNEEEYLLTMGERQSLRLNMTKMSNEEFLNCVLEHLKKLRDVCKIDIDDNHLIANTVFSEENNKAENGLSQMELPPQ